MQETQEKFIEALRELEENNTVEAMVALFTEQSTIGNVTSTHSFTGSAGAREFWEAYRHTFGTVKSVFKNKVHSDQVSALEWTTTGTSTGGHEIEYSGVSILEIDGDQISRFYAYFNPSDLGNQIAGE